MCNPKTKPRHDGTEGTTTDSLLPIDHFHAQFDRFGEPLPRFVMRPSPDLVETGVYDLNIHAARRFHVVPRFEPTSFTVGPNVFYNGILGDEEQEIPPLENTSGEEWVSTSTGFEFSAEPDGVIPAVIDDMARRNEFMTRVQALTSLIDEAAELSRNVPIAHVSPQDFMRYVLMSRAYV